MRDTPFPATRATDVDFFGQRPRQVLRTMRALGRLRRTSRLRIFANSLALRSGPFLRRRQSLQTSNSASQVASLVSKKSLTSLVDFKPIKFAVRRKRSAKPAQWRQQIPPSCTKYIQPPHVSRKPRPRFCLGVKCAVWPINELTRVADSLIESRYEESTSRIRRSRLPKVNVPVIYL